MNVALPICWGRVAPVFDAAGTLLVVENAGARDAVRDELCIEGLPLQLRVRRLVDSDADVLICGAISNRLANMVLAAAVQLVPLVTGRIAEVLDAYLSGRLPDPHFAMPGSFSVNPEHLLGTDVSALRGSYRWGTQVVQQAQRLSRQRAPVRSAGNHRNRSQARSLT